MKKILQYRTFVFIAMALMLFARGGACQTLSAEKVYEKVNDAVVKIYQFQDTNAYPVAQASGVIIRKYAWLVTNYHVIRDGLILKAQHNNKTYAIEGVLSIDPDKDIAILQLKDADKIKKDKSIPDIAIGNSDDLQVGQKIYAIGSPKGFENTMTDGIVSGLRSEDDSTRNLVQISAPISPGSSGGAIVGDKGELVGISAEIIVSLGAQNLNFAIPINEIMATGHAGQTANGGPETYLKGDALAKYFYDKGTGAFMKRDYDSAVIYFKKSLPLSTNFKKPLVYYAVGAGCLYTGNTKEAQKNFEAAIGLAPNFAEPYYALFQVYAQQGDLQTAMQNQLMAYRLKPELRQFKSPYIIPLPY